MSAQTPVSDHVETFGIVYFARMVDKIRLHAAGLLPASFHGHLGFADPTSFDSRFCRFWELDYEQVKARTLQGGTAEEIFTDLFRDRKPPNQEQIFVWNLFLLKRGWRDSGSDGLRAEKAEEGFADRGDIQTYVDLHDVEEGRPVRARFG
ncbi:DUF5069 domain-containing protein [Opitutaceae bacterium TAV4]|nr:DUF5069 domain-containing protein [Opitutaceae bacterium TAV4]RRJ98691.1 DUF5069 domain-containing protein [Opitutaceae bacterium TAV3]